MLKDFYYVKQLQTVENTHTVTVQLNEKHAIFDGHFPDNPIMPGVCMIQIVKNLVEEITQQQWSMAQVSNVKFMALINPFVSNVLDITISIQDLKEELKVKSSITHQGTPAFKMNSSYLLK